MTRKASILLLFAMLLMPASWATPSASRKTAVVHSSVPGDAQIESTIRTKLAKSKIGKDGFRFKVAHGVVTWEGATNVMQHKGAATRMAHSAGAASVVNNIQVSAAAKTKALQGLKRASIQK